MPVFDNGESEPSSTSDRTERVLGECSAAGFVDEGFARIRIYAAASSGTKSTLAIGERGLDSGTSRSIHCSLYVRCTTRAKASGVIIARWCRNALHRGIACDPSAWRMHRSDHAIRSLRGRRTIDSDEHSMPKHATSASMKVVSQIVRPAVRARRRRSRAIHLHHIDAEARRGPPMARPAPVASHRVPRFDAERRLDLHVRVVPT